MNLETKQQAVTEFAANFGEAGGTFLVNFEGITCADLTLVRNQLREAGSKMAVVKNTLAKKAIADTEMKALTSMFEGPTAVIWSGEDPVQPAKILLEFKKTREKFVLKGGWVDGAAIGAKDIEALAKLPSKPELQANLLALINAPATQLLRMINAPASSLVRLLEAWRGEVEKKG